MSVLVRKRRLSRFEPVYNATVIRENIHVLCCRSFGVNPDKIFRERFEYKGITYKSQTDLIAELFESKQKLHNMSDFLISDVRAANAVYIKDLETIKLRIKYQDQALFDCESLIGKLQDVGNIFEVNLNIFRESMESVDKEIKLLKDWKRSTLRHLSKFLINERSL